MDDSIVCISTVRINLGSNMYAFRRMNGPGPLRSDKLGQARPLHGLELNFRGVVEKAVHLQLSLQSKLLLHITQCQVFHRVYQRLGKTLCQLCTTVRWYRFPRS